MSAPKKYIFIDRDGVLNTTLPPYVSKWTEFVWYPWTFKALRSLLKNGANLFLITNQSGVGRGYFSEETLQEIFAKMKNRLNQSGLQFTDMYYCPHSPEDECNCRKPAPGMLEDAAANYDFELAGSWLIGDHYTDIAAGNAVGANTILVKSLRDGSEVRDQCQPDFVVSNLLEASEIIIGKWRKAV
ncbi:MAG: D-glycero-beta-D-manno-heptose-1,7-bisphosphate 7-phosphatase [Candidatus Marinimicrobia bacterium]|nr:D-glycero-beta-D-manno-heptose-1,7-bisphosphate 7-phosphatase [Candidatus Neomarinimicrobiota bacterium]